MKIIGFSRKGFLYIQHKSGTIFASQLNHSESYMLNNFSSLFEFNTLEEMRAFVESPVEGDYANTPEEFSE
jgi:hypothetical protein